MPDMPLPSAAPPPEPEACWRDTPLHRLMLTALLNTLDATLLGSASATRTLEEWSQRHRLASPPTLRAVNLRTPPRPCPPNLQAALRLPASVPAGTLRYRHVRLMCGPIVLSEAENWYLPARLTPAMNEELDTTETPFGRVTAALAFTRQLVQAERLWSALPAGWELGPLPTGSGLPLEFPPLLFRHHATLSRQDGTPISAVIESYTAGAFSFPPPEVAYQPSSSA
ncbi:hypothetical protein OQ252_06545 [Acetobacter farinalis]|uniref:Uncharacterized protein n=1 Tax=Acetobacter farinalis TaxID=1260984 RepID=A0ABT3Q708_9PROT|nr:hypothetical protein [Acetobacter farinalis]MCX2561056.1 hypothetical protein [Acetobacter farinalis]NHO29694.1 hypothetical protein [Acetobacter farinalis]